jgi:hypothetical protein
VLLSEAAPSPAVPDHVSADIHAAVDRIGLAYQRVNEGDWSAWSLNRDAVICVSRALEMALKDLLGCEGGTLQRLVDSAIKQDKLQESDREWLEGLRRFRNEAAHGQGPHPWPSVTADLWRKATRTINGMYTKAG